MRTGRETYIRFFASDLFDQAWRAVKMQHDRLIQATEKTPEATRSVDFEFFFVALDWLRRAAAFACLDVPLPELSPEIEAFDKAVPDLFRHVVEHFDDLVRGKLGAAKKRGARPGALPEKMGWRFDKSGHVDDASAGFFEAKTTLRLKPAFAAAQRLRKAVRAELAG